MKSLREFLAEAKTDLDPGPLDEGFRRYHITHGFMTHDVTARTEREAHKTLEKHYRGHDFTRDKATRVVVGKKVGGAKRARVTNWKLHGPYYDENYQPRKRSDGRPVGWNDPDLKIK